MLTSTINMSLRGVRHDVSACYVSDWYVETGADIGIANFAATERNDGLTNMTCVTVAIL